MKQFWVYSVMGNFGSGKTFWTFLEISQLEKEKNFIIANVPYKFVDLFYSEAQELYQILDHLEAWVYGTNNDIFTYYFTKWSFKNIVLVVDEAHLYFNARKWDKWGLMERLDILLTQCRKRNIKIFFISQRLKRVDINIRRMTDFVIRYKLRRIPILWIQWSMKTIYENEWDLADIQGDDSKTYVMNSESWKIKTDIEKSVMQSDLFLPLLKIFRFPLGKRLSKGQFSNFVWEAHNSYFISGLPTIWTRVKFMEEELKIKDKPLSVKEQKIKDWIAKNLPTLVSLLRKEKKEKNVYDYFPVCIYKNNPLYVDYVNNGCINWPSVGHNSWSDASNATDAMTGENVDTQNWVIWWSLWNSTNNATPTKRIESFRELREFEDWVWNGSSVSTNTRTNRRTRKLFKRVK